LHSPFVFDTIRKRKMLGWGKINTKRIIQNLTPKTVVIDKRKVRRCRLQMKDAGIEFKAI
jgi:hypothetical protein